MELLVNSTSGKGSSLDFSGSLVGGRVVVVLKHLLEPPSSFSLSFFLRIPAQVIFDSEHQE